MTPTSKRFRLEHDRTDTIALTACCTYRCLINTASLLMHSQFTPISRLTLAEAVAQRRHPRNRATVNLAPHRDELLRLSLEGESVGSLAGGLRELGISIGHETLRLWLNRELGRKPAKRKKRTKATALSQPAAANASQGPVITVRNPMPPA
jgi:hypothetical protein